MAKELPYFKFEPAEWESGNIQAVSRESKGLFIEICSLYWLRLGELPYALALQKLCNGNAEQLTELCNLEILGVEDSQIVIEFLDEQLNEFQKISEKRAKAANKRWKDAKGMQLHKHSNAIREEERREEERRKENISARKQSFLDQLKEVKKKTDSSEMLNKFFLYWTEHGINDKKMRFEKEKSFCVSRRLSRWRENQSKFEPKQSRSEYINQELNKHFGNNEPEPEQTHDIDYTEVDIDDFKGL